MDGSAIADPVGTAVPAYDEDPDEEFRGPSALREQFYDDDDQSYYEGDPLEPSIAQSGLPYEEPQVDILRDYTHSSECDSAQFGS